MVLVVEPAVECVGKGVMDGGERRGIGSGGHFTDLFAKFYGNSMQVSGAKASPGGSDYD